MNVTINTSLNSKMNKKCTTELRLPCVDEKKEIWKKKMPNYKVDGYLKKTPCTM